MCVVAIGRDVKRGGEGMNAREENKKNWAGVVHRRMLVKCRVEVKPKALPRTFPIFFSGEARLFIEIEIGIDFQIHFHA